MQSDENEKSSSDSNSYGINQSILFDDVFNIIQGRTSQTSITLNDGFKQQFTKLNRLDRNLW